MKSFLPYPLNRILRRYNQGKRDHVAPIGEKVNACRNLVGEPHGKTPLRRPRRRWEECIRMYLKEIWSEDAQ
jgi:hypothetical protein